MEDGARHLRRRRALHHLSVIGDGALLAGLLAVFAWCWYLVYDAQRSVAELLEERRRLRYELMLSCIKLEAERERLTAACARQRAKRLQAAAEIDRMKTQVDELRELVAAYTMLAGAKDGLSELRGDLSEFGRLMQDDGEPP